MPILLFYSCHSTVLYYHCVIWIQNLELLYYMKNFNTMKLFKIMIMHNCSVRWVVHLVHTCKIQFDVFKKIKKDETLDQSIWKHY